MPIVRSTSSAVAEGTLTEPLAAWVCDLRYEDLPDDVVRKAKAHVLFLIGGACVGGSSLVGTRPRDRAPARRNQRTEHDHR